MLLKICSSIKFIIAGVINPFILCGLLGGLSLQAYSASIAPQAQNTKVNMTFDRMSLPANIYIWQNVFGGSSDAGECTDSANCKDKDSINSLTCYSATDPTNGACQVMLMWSDNPNNDNSKALTLRFTHGSGQTKDLKITSIKANTSYASWISGYHLTPGGVPYFYSLIGAKETFSCRSLAC